MENLEKELKEYKPFNEQEKRDKELILQWLQNGDKIFTRENKVAHITVSAWIVNANRDKVLMVYHNIYDSWAWLGGHADGNKNLREVVLKEVEEESGVKEVKFLSADIFSIEILTVAGHEKRGEYVSSHLHLNFTFLLEADEKMSLQIKPDENSGVEWIKVDEISKRSSEKWFVERIYSKLYRKVKENFNKVI
ncbi:NUDIX hydrolase [uncultured Fusobacterium sp.]|uniref:NUDIX hydrolase n=1 Tax=uncultured Fusobacterium sp. TaxID=159267 RepID=UPI0025E9BE6B|nr:NUDIX hydrolase [uncultured Fusobacterium sp.]